jgi:hypothetical protein
MPRRTNSLRLDNSNYTWRRVQIMQLHLRTFPHLPNNHPSIVQIFSLASCSQTPSVYAPPLMLEINFYTHTEPEPNYSFVYFNYIVFESRREERRL